MKKLSVTEMHPTLMPHQEEAVHFLEKHDGVGLLAMEPGTGKTLSALEYLRRSGSFPALIVAPVSLLGMWKGELERWYPEISFGVLRGTKPQREKVAASGKQVYLIGYETFRMDFDGVTKIPFTACVLDESGKVRTPTAKVSKKIRAFQPRVRIALDGTPVSNTIADLWNVSEWVRPGVFFGNWYRFRSRYAIMNPYIPGKIDGWRDTDSIVKAASERIFWKKKTDVLKDLPSMTQVDVPLEMCPEEKRIYKQIKDELRVEFEGQELTITNALALLMRLRQAANGVFLAEGSPTKTKALCELIEALPPGEKVVVFSQFETVVSKLQETLGTALKLTSSRAVLKITGDMSAEERERAVRDFEHESSAKVIVMTSAGEKGLNLQCASYMVQYDLVWSAAAEEQRIGRIWRHGQDKPVTVWNLLMEGTVDMHMRRILGRKKQLADAVSAQGEVTYEDIEAILAD